MKPEDIRRLYNQEDAATDAEAAQTQSDMRTDPDMARSALLTIYALAEDDPAFSGLLNVILKVGMMQLLVRATEDDDAFALKIGELISDVMQKTSKPGPRGKHRPNKPKSA